MKSSNKPQKDSEPRGHKTITFTILYNNTAEHAGISDKDTNVHTIVSDIFLEKLLHTTGKKSARFPLNYTIYPQRPGP